jgi:hypothetical protein
MEEESYNYNSMIWYDDAQLLHLRRLCTKEFLAVFNQGVKVVKTRAYFSGARDLPATFCSLNSLLYRTTLAVTGSRQRLRSSRQTKSRYLLGARAEMDLVVPSWSTWAIETIPPPLTGRGAES